MNRYLKILLAALLLTAISVFAGAGAEGSGYMYVPVNEGEIWLTDYDGTLTGDVVLPAEIEGCPVTGIAQDAFKDQDEVTSVTIPESVRELGWYVFEDCDNLESVIFECWDAEVEFESFSGAHLYVPYGSSTQAWVRDREYRFSCLSDATENGWGYVLLDDGTAAVTLAPEGAAGDIAVPETLGGATVTKIGPGAFLFCEAESVTMPETVCEIEAYAFAGANGPKHVWLQDNCVSEGSAFIGRAKAHVNLNSEAYYSIAQWTEANYCVEGCAVENGFRYYIENGDIYIAGYEGDFNGDLMIPGTIAGCSVSKIAPNAFRNCEGITSVTFPEDYYIGIGRYAFSGCTSLRSVNGFTDGWAEVGAFSGCTALESFVVPEGWGAINDEMFKGCTSLSYVQLPENMEMLCERAFQGCTGLTEIDLPGNVYCLGNECFEGCTGLTAIVLPDAPRDAYYGREVFKDCTNLRSVVFESGITFETIGDQFFDDCVNLESVSIPWSANMDQIPYRFFYDCAKLGEVYIPASVTYLDGAAFAGCDNVTLRVVENSEAHAHAVEYGLDFELVGGTDEASGFQYIGDETESWIVGYVGEGGSVTIPETLGGATVTGFDAETFKGGAKITAVTIPARVKGIPARAFEALTGLRSVTLAEGLEVIGANAFSSSGIESIVIPDSVTLMSNAFMVCENLKSVVIGDGLKMIEYVTFNGCTALETVEIGDGVEIIGGSAFANCSNLETVKLGDSVEYIYAYAFENCAKLKTVENTGALREISGGAFVGCESLESMLLPHKFRSFAPDVFEGCTALTVQVYRNSSAYYYCRDYGIPYEIIVPETSIFEYLVRDDGTAWISGFVMGKETELTLPSEIDGYTVTGVDSWAMSEDSRLKKITVPESITYICYGAFYNCAKLEELVLHENLTLEGEPVHYGARVRVPFGAAIARTLMDWGYNVSYLPDGVTDDGFEYVINGSEAILCGYSGDATGRLVFPSEVNGYTVSGIGDGVLSGRSDIHTIVIPENIGMLTGRPFANNDAITAVYLPDHCEIESGEVFDDEAVFYVTADTTAYYALCNIYGGGRVSPLGNCVDGDFEYYLPDGGYYAKVTGYTGSDAHVEVPSQLNGHVVDGIAAGAFRGNTAIVSVTLPETMEFIRQDAFRGCTALETVNAPLYDYSYLQMSARAFKDCVSLKNFNCTGNISWIPQQCFEGCTSLTEIPCADQLDTIETGAFRGCTGLEAVETSARYIDSYAFADCTGLKNLRLAEDTAYISEGCFEGCTALTEVVIPKMGENSYIDDYAFAGCTGLKSVTIVEGAVIDRICERTFEGCTSLETVNIPVGMHLREIYGNAFKDCTALEEITLPPSLESIGYEVFNGCDHVTVRVASGSVAHQYCIEYGLDYVIMSAVDAATGFEYVSENESCVITGYEGTAAEVTIPDTLNGCTVVGVGANAFENAAVSTVTIPESVTFIGSRAFAGSALSEINLPKQLKNLGTEAFMNCVNLTAIEVPGGVSSLHPRVFEGCTALADVTLNEGVGSIQNGAFRNCASLTELVLPYSCDWFEWDSFENCGVVLKIIKGCSGEYSAQNYGVPYEYYVPEEDVFQYSYDPQLGGAYIYRVVSDDDTEVVFPAEINGYPVVMISSNLLAGNTVITDVTIPESVESIGQWAFSECTALKNVYLPADTGIGYGCFFHCPEVTVWVPYGSASAEYVQSFDIPHHYYADFEEDGMGYVITGDGEVCLAYGQENLTGEITIPAAVQNGAYSVTEIAPYAFLNQSGLSGVKFEGEVVFVGYRAFDGCTGINAIRLPAGMTFNTSGDFDNSILLLVPYGSAAYECASRYGNYIYRVVGDRYDAASHAWYYVNDIGHMTISHFCCAENGCDVPADFVVPAELNGQAVEGLGIDAFDGVAGRVTTITLPASLHMFADGALNGCENVTFRVYEDTAAADYVAEMGFAYEIITVYTYEMIDDESVRLTGATESFSGKMYIPAEVSGYRVAEIASGAFADQTGVTEVQVSEDILFAADSFPANAVLRVLYRSEAAELADSLGLVYQYIGIGEQYGKEYLILEDGSEMLVRVSEKVDTDNAWFGSGLDGDISAVGPYAFHGNSSVRLASFDYYVETLEPHAFEGDHNLKIVEINGVENAYESSFPADMIVRANENSAALELAEEMGLETVMVGGWYDGGMSYTVDENGGAWINDYHYESGRVYIPEKLGDAPVVGIKAGAFTHVNSCLMPESLTEIHPLAFISSAGMTAQVVENSAAHEWCADNGVDYTFYDPDEIQWLTEALDDGTLKLTGAIGVLEGEIELPGEVGGVTVTEIGGSAFSGMGGITKVVIPDTVRAIEEFAFLCEELESVVIPDSVVSLGGVYNYEVFYSNTTLHVSAGSAAEEYGWRYGNPMIYRPQMICDDFGFAYTDSGMLVVSYEGTEFGDLVVPAMVDGWEVEGVQAEAFKGMDRITSITLPDTVRLIGESAFENCSALERVDLGGNVGSIDHYAFRGCSALKEINLTEELYFIGSEAFAATGLTEVVLNNVTIYSEAFMNCQDLETVRFEGWCEELPDSLFENCTSLKNIEIPEGVWLIGDACFKGCTSLETLVVPRDIEEFGRDVFEGCDNLTLYVSNNSWAFLEAQNKGIPCVVTDEVDEASGLTYVIENNLAIVTGVKPGSAPSVVNIPAKLGGKTVDEIGMYAFSGLGCIEELTIPDTVTYIGMHALENLRIEEIELPSDLSFIPECMMAHCVNLKSIVIPEGIHGIGDDAFRGCTSLETIILPDSLEYLDYYVFADCVSLGRVFFPNGMYYMPRNAFEGCENLVIAAVRGSYALEFAENYGFAYEIYGTETGDGLYSYAVKEDGTAVLLTVDESISGDVTVPAEIDGYTVTEIGPSAYHSCHEITTLTVPGTVKVIGNHAFHWCDGITEVTLCEGVEKIGEYVFANCYALETVNLPDTLKEAGGEAFAYDNSLVSITIPASLTKIADFMFMECSGLQNVEISEGVEVIGECAFSGCSSLESVELPDTLKKIEGWAFESTGLKEITIPASVTEVGSQVFWGDYALTVDCCASVEVARELQRNSGGCTVIYHESETLPGFSNYIINSYERNDAEIQRLTLGDYIGNASELVIPATVDGMQLNEIEAETFRGNETLTSVTIEEGVKEIYAYAFADCPNLKYVSLPDSLMDMRTGMFMNCTALESITLILGNQDGGYASCIENSAFEGCTALKEVIVPDDADYAWFGDRAFAGCVNLEKVTMGEDAYIGEIGDEAFLNCGKLEKFVMPDPNTSITETSFEGCGKITLYVYKNSAAYRSCLEIPLNYKLLDKVDNGITYAVRSGSAYVTGLENKDMAGELVVPKTLGGYPVEGIGDYAFADCDNLTSVILPSGLSAIDEYAFSGCGSLTHVTLPSGLNYVGDYAFADCDSLTRVTLPSGLRTIFSYAFAGCDNLTHVILPSGLWYIADGAFSDCGKLEYVKVPDGIDEISDEAFEGSPNVVVYGSEGSYAQEYCDRCGVRFEILASVSEVEIAPDELWVPSGISFKPVYRTEPADAVTDLEFSSDNEAVATVDGDGVITVHGAGEAVITAAYVENSDYFDQLTIHADAAPVMTVPSAMKVIDDEAFMGSDAVVVDLSKVSGVEIGVRAFADCPELRTLILPEGADVDMSFIEGSSVAVFCPDADLALEIEDHYGIYTVSLK